MAGVQSLRNVWKLYVTNLPWTVGDNELKKYFSKFGPVQNALVVFDKNTGLSRNYGFVIYSNREGFEAASGATHKLEGNSLKVKPSENS